MRSAQRVARGDTQRGIDTARVEVTASYVRPGIGLTAARSRSPRSTRLTAAGALQVLARYAAVSVDDGIRRRICGRRRQPGSGSGASA